MWDRCGLTLPPGFCMNGGHRGGCRYAVGVAERYHVKDDEGKPVAALQAAGLCDWPVQGDERIEKLVKRMQLASHGAGTASRGMWLGLRVIAWWGSFLAIMWLMRGMGLPGWVPLVALAIVWVVVVRVLARMRISTHGEAIAKLMLAEGLCPGCGYNFVGLVDVGGDALVRCPECAAAWKRERIERAEAFMGGARMGSVLTKIRAGDNLGWASTKDARGEMYSVVHPMLREQVKLARLVRDEEREKRLIAAREAVSGIGLRMRLVVAAASFGLAVVVWMWWARMPGAIGGPRILLVLVPVSLGVLGVGMLLGGFTLSSSRVVRVLIENGLCPSCAGELEEEVEGNRGCEKCRAVWPCGAAISSHHQ